jgi:hypothetical protein
VSTRRGGKQLLVLFGKVPEVASWIAVIFPMKFNKILANLFPTSQKKSYTSFSKLIRLMTFTLIIVTLNSVAGVVPRLLAG